MKINIHAGLYPAMKLKNIGVVSWDQKCHLYTLNNILIAQRMEATLAL